MVVPCISRLESVSCSPSEEVSPTALTQVFQQKHDTKHATRPSGKLLVVQVGNFGTRIAPRLKSSKLVPSAASMMIQAFLGLSSQLDWISLVDFHILGGVLQPDIVWDRACFAVFVYKLDVVQSSCTACAGGSADLEPAECTHRGGGSSRWSLSPPVPAILQRAECSVLRRV